jgi:hypothetical protein
MARAFGIPQQPLLAVLNSFAQPLLLGVQSVEELLRELTAENVKENAFKVFARRAQLVITGLMHIRWGCVQPLALSCISFAPAWCPPTSPSHLLTTPLAHPTCSILLLPKKAAGEEPGARPSAKQAGGKSSGARGSKASHPASHATSEDVMQDSATALQEFGFPTDSTDLERWSMVRLPPHPLHSFNLPPPHTDTLIHASSQAPVPPPVPSVPCCNCPSIMWHHVMDLPAWVCPYPAPGFPMPA